MVRGYGETCPIRSLLWVFVEDTKVTPDKFCKVEDQTEVWPQAMNLGGKSQSGFKKDLQFEMTIQINAACF